MIILLTTLVPTHPPRNGVEFKTFALQGIIGLEGVGKAVDASAKRPGHIRIPGPVSVSFMSGTQLLRAGISMLLAGIERLYLIMI